MLMNNKQRIFRYSLPLRAHVEQVHEEVFDQGAWSRRVLCLSEVGIQDGMPPKRTGTSGAVSVSNCSRSTSSFSGNTENLPFVILCHASEDLAAAAIESGLPLDPFGLT